jgi:hypothetical protein
MISPNIDVKLSVSTFFFFAGIAISYFSHIGWWSLAGLFYLVAAQKLGWITICSFILSIFFFALGIWRIGWMF